MSYRIEPDKPLTDEVVRIAQKQYSKAIESLHTQRDGPHRAIHDARKRFKRLRGLFRLVRDAAPDFAASENARVRDMAQSLSVAREATAHTEALDRLLATEATRENHEALFAIRNRLALRRDRLAAEQAGLQARIAEALEGCEAGIAALDGLQLPEKRKKAIAVLASGAAKNYGRALRALETANKSGEPEAWHDLRKRVKYHRMHVNLLRRAWPGEMALRAEVADIAGEALGDDHDLWALEQLVSDHPAAIGDADEIAILRACMAAQSQRLREDVRRIVKNLLKDDKKLVRSRLTALYRDATK